MAASLSRNRTLLTTVCRLGSPAERGLHSTAVCCKNRAARVRVGKGDKPVTYEQAMPPHQIAHRKGWLSHHTNFLPHTEFIFTTRDLPISFVYNTEREDAHTNGNLTGEEGAAERTVEDLFIRRFIYGTFHGCLANELVIKRRGNLLIICAVMLQKLLPHKYYFLVGYTEELLSHFYKCPVKMEIQTIGEKTVYKYL